MKIKNIALLLSFLLVITINNNGFAQPILEWSKNYGGSDSDIPRDIELTTDGGYIFAGWSRSTNGDVGGNNGGQDAWIVKMDDEGNLEWEKNYGGSDDDTAGSIKQTTDGGYIVSGYSRSTDGDVGGNNGEQDAWVMKLDNEGNIQWSKNYGGADKELAFDIVQTADNGYAFLSSSESFNGDVGGNNGGRDFWIVKLDDAGNLQWEKNYGGSAWDTPSSIKELTNGGYMVAGFTGSDDGDIGENFGSNDSWLLKLDNEGNLEWEKSYGGSDNDVSYDMDQTIDGGYVLAGRSNSSDGNVGGNNGEHDSWIIKLDADGNLEWNKHFGGAENDAALTIMQTLGGGYIAAGDSRSNDGDVAGNNGEQDTWIIKLDSEGNLEWEKNYGGSATDLARDIVQNSAGEFIITNWTESADGDLQVNNGSSDFWIMKIIDPNATSTQTPNINSKVTISPNPSNGQFIINTDDLTTPMNVKIFDALGHSIYRKNGVHGPLSIVDLPKGNYYIQIVTDGFSVTKKLIVL